MVRGAIAVAVAPPTVDVADAIAITYDVEIAMTHRRIAAAGSFEGAHWLAG